MEDNQAQQPKTRFVTFDDAELEQKLEDAQNKNTKKAEAKAMKAFRKCLEANNASEQNEFWKMDNETLDKNLAKFYAGARKEEGGKYKLNSMVQFRHSLIRIIRDKRNDPHLTNKHFPKAQKAWKMMEENLKKEGLAVTEGAKEIIEADKYLSELNVTARNIARLIQLSHNPINIELNIEPFSQLNRIGNVQLDFQLDSQK